jgi:hypothetical protein
MAFMVKPESGIPTLSFEYYLGQARVLPRIAVADVRMQIILDNPSRQDILYREMFGPFGNEFYLLLEGISLKRAGKPMGAILNLKVEQAEELGENWENFVGHHGAQELLKKFDKVLLEGRPYEDFREYVADLRRVGVSKKIEALERSIEHPLGFKAIEAAYNDRRNSVLAVTAALMSASGINPSQFYY